MEFDNKKLDQNYLRAQKRVEDIKSFYTHLVVFVIIMPLIIYINYATYWDYQWFWFTLFGWGMGVAIHGFMTFAISNNWEERKIKQFMEEDKNSNF